MKEITADAGLIAACGLYCGSCGSYLKEKCGGCAKNESATWCAVRKCCIENNFKSCADCKKFPDARECKMFNNFISKTIGFFLRSSRPKCIERIKQTGYEQYAREMAENKTATIKP